MEKKENWGKDLNKIKNIVAFCILMENNGGILNKSPQYIEEKFNRYILSSNEDEWQYGLDVINRKKLEEYIYRWLMSREELQKEKKDLEEKIETMRSLMKILEENRSILSDTFDISSLLNQLYWLETKYSIIVKFYNEKG